MLNNKESCVDTIGEKLASMYIEAGDMGVYTEIAQKMLNSGKSEEDIEVELRTLYGATDDEIGSLRESLFYKEASSVSSFVEEVQSVKNHIEEVVDWINGIEDKFSPEKFDKILNQLVQANMALLSALTELGGEPPADVE